MYKVILLEAGEEYVFDHKSLVDKSFTLTYHKCEEQPVVNWEDMLVYYQGRVIAEIESYDFPPLHRSPVHF